MTLLIVRLRLAMWRTAVSRSTLQLASSIVGGLAALVVVGVLGPWLVLLAGQPVRVTALVVPLFTIATLMWAVLSLIATGVDSILDPARFSVLPLRAHELARGLLAAVLLSRAVTSALARVMTTRFGRILGAFVVSLVTLVPLGLNLLLTTGSIAADLSTFDATRSAQIASWTQVGWAWGLPFDVATGRWGAAAVHLVLALAFDGPAWWLHVAVGVPGWQDRLGRVLATTVVFGPVVLLTYAVSLALGVVTAPLPWLTITVVAFFASLGLAVLVGAYLPGTAPRTGGNPFAATSGGAAQGCLTAIVSFVGPIVLTAPVAWRGRHRERPWADGCCSPWARPTGSGSSWWGSSSAAHAWTPGRQSCSASWRPRRSDAVSGPRQRAEDPDGWTHGHTMAVRARSPHAQGAGGMAALHVRGFALGRRAAGRLTASHADRARRSSGRRNVRTSAPSNVQ